MTKIHIQDIKKSFGKKAVLSGVELSATAGQCIGILGNNGCGKSTLLNILSGILKPDGGQFLCDDIDLIRNTKCREKLVSYVPQTPTLIEELNAYDNLLLWYTKSEIKASLQSGVLSLLGVRDFLKTTVSKMSGGMKKRLSIGCAMSNRPQILLLDEPTAALDPGCKKTIGEYILKFKSAGGIVLLVTHDYAEISLCDQCYFMENGVLIPFDKTESLSGTVSDL